MTVTPARRRIPGLVAALLAAASLAAACAAPGPGGGPAPDDESTPPPSAAPAPGLYEIDDGRVRAIGMLARLELEGGFWAVLDVRPDEKPSPEDTADVVAVVPNAEEVRPDIGDLLGEYVAVTGKRLGGPSTRMAGPEVEAESIEPVEPQP